MKLASYLKRSRHGIYYYRIQYRDGSSRRREMSASLGTRDPLEARSLAYALTSRIKPFLTPRTGKTMAFDPRDLDPETIRELTLKGLKLGNATISEVEISDDPVQRKKDLDTLTEFAKSFQIPETPEQSRLRAQFEKEKNEIAGLLQENQLTVEQAIKKFISQDKGALAQSTQTTYRSRLEMLGRNVGSTRLVSSISAKDMSRAFADLILNAPHNSKRNIKKEGRISPATAEDTLRTWKSFFDFLRSSGDYSHDNPASALRPPARPKSSGDAGAEAFETEELKAIFDKERFAKFERPHQFFIPLLALYTGARANELASLPLSAITQESGCDCFSFKFNPEENQRVKNASSVRTIPLHPIIRQSGFFDYIEDIKAIGADRLFPYLPLEERTGKRERYVSRDINNYFKEVGVYVFRKKTLHSFRDTFISFLSEAAGGTTNYSRHYVGHAALDTHERDYTRKAKIELLDKFVASKIPGFGLDLSWLRYEKGRWDEWIKANLCP